MEFRQFLRPLGVALAPLTVGVGGGGAGAWWWLYSERKDIEVKLTEAGIALEEVKARTYDLERQRKVVEGELAEAIKNKELNEQEIKDLNEKIGALDKEKKSLEEEEKQLGDEIKKLTENQKKLYSEMQEKQKDLLRNIADLQSKKSLLKEKEDQISGLEAQKQRLQNEKQELESQNNASQKNKVQLDASIKTLKTKLEQLDDENKKLIVEKGNYEEEVKRKEKSVEEQIKTIKTQNVALDDSLIGLSRKVQENAQKKKENEGIRSRVTQKIQELEEKNKEISKQQENLLKKQMELEAQINKNNKQIQQISSLNKESEEELKEISLLEQQLTEAKHKSEQEDQNLSEKQTELDGKNERISLDRTTISSHEITIKEKESEINRLQERASRSKRQISDFYGIVLTGKSKSKNYDFSNTDIDQISFVSSEQNDGQASFKAVDDQGREVSFNVKTTSFGLESALSSIEAMDNFGSWNGKFKLTISKPWWSCVAESSCDFWKSISEEEIDVSEIFEEEHKQAAIKVLLAIKLLQGVSFQSQDGVFELKLPDYANGLAAMLSKEEPCLLTVNVHSFKTKDNFIKYWITKTFEQVKNKSSDFSEIFHPALKGSSHQLKS